MFQLQAEGKGIRLELILHDSLPHSIVSDQRRLKQILINLLSNALKFSNSAGTSEPKTITVKCVLIGTFLKLNVVDTGIGINQDDQARLFRPFGRLAGSNDENRQGVGLGLNICR